MAVHLNRLSTTIWLVLMVWAVFRLLLSKREPPSTVAWLLFVTLVPFLGPVVFFFFGPQRVERHAVRRRKEIEKRLSLSSGQVHASATDGAARATNLPVMERGVFELAQRISEYGATQGNKVELIHDPYDALIAMKNAIEQARAFIHLEYYIIAGDEVTKQLFGYLEEAAKRGIEVRILYDSLGSLFLSRMYFRPLTRWGVKIAGFLPLFSFNPQRLNVNFRNHRKILVVDGLVAFTGGTNIGKEYLGRRNQNQWRDYTVRVEGPVCRQLEDVFARDWQFTTAEDLFLPKYYPDAEPAGDATVQVLESGPDSPFRALHQAIFLALSSAEREILLTTPYFVPDPAIMSAVCVAALRGVKVRLCLPQKSDHPLVQLATRSFYEDLLAAGVEVHEYIPRILHAKLIVIDNAWTILGSANMDIRSFRLNFELNLLVHGPSVAGQGRTLFETDLAVSKLIAEDAFLARGIVTRLAENAARLLSPVL